MIEKSAELHANKSASSLRVGPKTAFIRFYSNYVKLSGRASRSEYWWIALFFFLVALVLQFAALVASDPALTFYHQDGVSLVFMVGLLLLILFSIVPLISLSVRRLHDSNHSGWLFLVNLIPFIGQVILIVFLSLPSKASGARFDRPGK